MLYTLSAGYPFFLIAFLQIVTFSGIYFKLGDLMSMFSLQSGDSQSVGSRIMRRPRMLMNTHMHRLQHKLGRSVAALGAGAAVSKASKQSGAASSSVASRTTQADHTRPDGQTGTEEKASFGKRAGQAAGAVMDTKGRIVDTAAGLKEQAKDLPVNAKYALYHGKTQVSEGVHDFTSSIHEIHVRSHMLEEFPVAGAQVVQEDHCGASGGNGTGGAEKRICHRTKEIRSPCP